MRWFGLYTNQVPQTGLHLEQYVAHPENLYVTSEVQDTLTQHRK